MSTRAPRPVPVTPDIDEIEDAPTRRYSEAADGGGAWAFFTPTIVILIVLAIILIVVLGFVFYRRGSKPADPTPTTPGAAPSSTAPPGAAPTGTPAGGAAPGTPAAHPPQAAAQAPKPPTTVAGLYVPPNMPTLDELAALGAKKEQPKPMSNTTVHNEEEILGLMGAEPTTGAEDAGKDGEEVDDADGDE